MSQTTTPPHLDAAEDKTCPVCETQIKKGQPIYRVNGHWCANLKCLEDAKHPLGPAPKGTKTWKCRCGSDEKCFWNSTNTVILRACDQKPHVHLDDQDRAGGLKIENGRLKDELARLRLANEGLRMHNQYLLDQRPKQS